jgi:hypothetical protein
MGSGGKGGGGGGAPNNPTIFKNISGNSSLEKQEIFKLNLKIIKNA